MLAICPCGGASMSPLYSELGWIFVAAVVVTAVGLGGAALKCFLKK